MSACSRPGTAALQADDGSLANSMWLSAVSTRSRMPFSASETSSRAVKAAARRRNGETFNLAASAINGSRRRSSAFSSARFPPGVSGLRYNSNRSSAMSAAIRPWVSIGTDAYISFTCPFLQFVWSVNGRPARPVSKESIAYENPFCNGFRRLCVSAFRSREFFANAWLTLAAAGPMPGFWDTMSWCACPISGHRALPAAFALNERRSRRLAGRSPR